MCALKGSLCGFRIGSSRMVLRLKTQLCIDKSIWEKYNLMGGHIGLTIECRSCEYVKFPLVATINSFLKWSKFFVMLFGQYIIARGNARPRCENMRGEEVHPSFRQRTNVGEVSQKGMDWSRSIWKVIYDALCVIWCRPMAWLRSAMQCCLPNLPRRSTC